MRDISEKLKILQGYKFTEDGKEEQPIVVVGPSGNSENKQTKLRVYAYGGCLGRVATRDNDFDRLAEGTGYAKYLEDTDGKARRRLEEILSLENGERKGSFLCDPEYLDLILKAAKTKFTKNGKDEKERRVQTRLVKKHMYKGLDDGWCVVDMEFCISEAGKRIQSDIVVFDKERGFGLIELKYLNESRVNLEKHYKDFLHAAKSPHAGEQVKELERRCGYLSQYGLINEALYKEGKKGCLLWYGFLFVGGQKQRSVELAEEIAKEFPKRMIDEDCQFWWIPEEDIETLSLRFDPSHTYQRFVED